jgi:glycine C-acetyltransferase
MRRAFCLEPSLNKAFLSQLSQQTQALHEQGLYKTERVISTPQQATIQVQGGPEVLNFCANNYLGLSDHPALVKAAQESLPHYGFGMSSVRFICGTQTVHKELEARLSKFLGMEDTILYGSCFDANGGLFETILDEQDAVISDALNHASIIDGVRLCKAKRFRYNNNDMADLEAKLKEADAAGARHKLIATDGVFSMDGIIADLKGICDLADKFRGVMGRVDILTGTLGKALGGASGGYTSARKEIVEWLRQRSRPYLFSNTLAPTIAATSIKVLDMLESDDSLRKKVHANSRHFREGMQKLGFKLAGADHPIVPVMLGDAKLAKTMADEMLKEGIYVIGFSFPVVPKDQARIRTQMSAAHETAHIDKAINAFGKVGHKLGVI